MKNYLLTIVLFAASLVFAGEAAADIRIYKVTVKAKALLAKKANSVNLSGYLILDTTELGNSRVVQVFKGKLYDFTGTQLEAILQPKEYDRFLNDSKENGVNDSEVYAVAEEISGVIGALLHIGKYSTKPVKFKSGAEFSNMARSLKGQGTIAIPGVEFYDITSRMRIDKLTGGDFASSIPGIMAVVDFLESKGFTAFDSPVF